MKKFIVEKTVRIPDTKIILEKGDKIVIISEAEATVGIPSETIVVPYSIPIPGYDSEGSSAIIDAGREVKYKVDITEAGFLLTLYYSHLKNMPFKFVKVPLLFTSKQEAESKGWNFKDSESKGITNSIPSGTELNGDAGIVDSKTVNEKSYSKRRK